MAKYLFLAALAAFALLVSFGCTQAPGGNPPPNLPQNGTLQGKVTVGPLCPVEPCQVTPKQMMEVYNSRKVFVYGKDPGKAAVEYRLQYEAGLGAAAYSIPLMPGNYTAWVSGADGVDPSRLMRPMLDIGAAGPKEVEIFKGRVTVLDFDIDTGIR